MPITARDGRRHWSLIAFVLVALTASAAETPEERIHNLATAIQSGEAADALSFFDPHLQNFTELKRDIEALASRPQTSCTITIKSTGQKDADLELDTRWTLELNSIDNGPLLVREESVSISMREIEGLWKIVSLTPTRVLATPDQTMYGPVAGLASSLSENDGPGALSFLDSRMRGFGEISSDVDALVNQTDVLCAIDIVQDNESGGVHKLDTDWYLQLKSRADTGSSERRRERVQLQIGLIKGKWRITSMNPIGILSPFKAP